MYGAPVHTGESLSIWPKTLPCRGSGSFKRAITAPSTTNRRTGGRVPVPGGRAFRDIMDRRSTFCNSWPNTAGRNLCQLTTSSAVRPGISNSPRSSRPARKTRRSPRFLEYRPPALKRRQPDRGLDRSPSASACRSRMWNRPGSFLLVGRIALRIRSAKSRPAIATVDAQVLPDRA